MMVLHTLPSVHCMRRLARQVLGILLTLAGPPRGRGEEKARDGRRMRSAPRGGPAVRTPPGSNDLGSKI